MRKAGVHRKPPSCRLHQRTCAPSKGTRSPFCSVKQPWHHQPLISYSGGVQWKVWQQHNCRVCACVASSSILRRVMLDRHHMHSAMRVVSGRSQSPHRPYLATFDALPTLSAVQAGRLERQLGLRADAAGIAGIGCCCGCRLLGGRLSRCVRQLAAVQLDLVRVKRLQQGRARVLQAQQQPDSLYASDAAAAHFESASRHSKCPCRLPLPPRLLLLTLLSRSVLGLTSSVRWRFTRGSSIIMPPSASASSDGESVAPWCAGAV
jgi:hypothetical protein